MDRKRKARRSAGTPPLSTVTPRTIIEKKRNGETLTDTEIAFFIRAYHKGEIADYHAAAFLMAAYLRGMTFDETLALTREMRDSGDVFDLSSIPGRKIGKHSTGGVGDKTSLLLAPIVAACGVTIPMITGRALGHTGGTLDKLQSIEGFNPQPSPRQVTRILARHHAILMGQTANIAPVDRRLYALRDSIGTVDSIPLITASILSKKLAEDLDGLVLDVKTGSGAFMRDLDRSLALARSLADTCSRMKTRVVVLITDMEQPLGRTVGNALEVKECLNFLNGSCEPDLETVTLTLASWMIWMGGGARTVHAARRMAYEAVSTGRAREAFLGLVRAQGGDTGCLDDPDRLPKARNVTPIKARQAGVVTAVDARTIGEACNILGAGRIRTEDAIDPSVGLELTKKVGDSVSRGDILCNLHWNDEARYRAGRPQIESAFTIGPRVNEPRPLIHAIVGD